jgi:hypothetical protein
MERMERIKTDLKNDPAFIRLIRQIRVQKNPNNKETLPTQDGSAVDIDDLASDVARPV